MRLPSILTAGLIAAAATIAAVAPAQASCFYNQSEVANIGVKLDCGWFCSNKWSIPKGDHNCRGGKGGPFWIDAVGKNDSFYLEGSVRDHGYVTVTGSCQAGIRAQIYAEDHSLRREVYAPGPLTDCR
ncbi:hypothetical protein ACM64Y_04155 [Novispirillum sp. DQ9]|uniref:hypothetical protein n=1 Tax=Novispirillum sp. DQ9 TaxID=3398612 RepID=UPI003C7ABFBA